MSGDGRELFQACFYTYFEDKRDLQAFILWGAKRQWNDFCRSNNLFNLHRNLVLYPAPFKSCLSGQEDCGCGEEAHKWLMAGIDRSRFCDPSDEAVAAVLKIAALLLVSTLSEFCLANGGRRDQAQRQTLSSQSSSRNRTHIF